MIKKTYTQVKMQFPVFTLIVVTEWKVEDSVAGQFAGGDPAQQVSGWGKVHEDPMWMKGQMERSQCSQGLWGWCE